MAKKNFSLGDAVLIFGLGDDEVYRGKICGKSHVNIVDTYVVELDEPDLLTDGWKHVAIVESCLTRI